MKKLLILIALMLFNQNSFSQEGYKPSDENVKAREWFEDARFGLFIHWGVYSVLGDGECNEGSVWEASMAASHFKLNNLYAIIDNNNFQQTGSNKHIMDTTRSFH